MGCELTLIPESTLTPAPVKIQVFPPSPLVKKDLTRLILSASEIFGAGGNAPSIKPGTRIFSKRVRFVLISP